MSKNKTKLLAIAALASCMALGAVSIAGSTFLGNRGEVFALDSAYNLALNSSNATYTDGEVIATASGQPVALAFSGASASSGNFCALSSGGYIANTREILGIKKLNLNFTGTIKLYAGACKNHWATEETMTASGEFALPKTANFFKIEAQGAATIASIEATYACEEADKSGISHTAGDMYHAFIKGEKVLLSKACTICDEATGTSYSHDKAADYTIAQGTWDYKAGTYGFELQSDGFYKSTNGGKDSTTATATFTCTSSGTLAFDWKASGEGSGTTMWDYLKVTNGSTEIVKAYSGSGTQYVDLTAGNVLTFSYTKDSGTSAGTDCGQFKAFAPAHSYQAITLEPNGASETYEPILAIDGAAQEELPTPTKTGMEFKGWYLDSEFTKIAKDSTIYTEDAIIYAKWEAPSAGNPLKNKRFMGSFQYYSSFSESNVTAYFTLQFNDTEEIAGILGKTTSTTSTYYNPWLAFTGTLDGSTLTITITEVKRGSTAYADKTATFTVNSTVNQLTCTSKTWTDTSFNIVDSLAELQA